MSVSKSPASTEMDNDSSEDGPSWVEVIEKARADLKKALEREVQEDYNRWAKWAEDKEIDLEEEYRTKNEYRANHGLYQEVEMEVEELRKEFRISKENKKQELCLRGKAAWEWWVRDGEALDGWRSRLEDSVMWRD